MIATCFYKTFFFRHPKEGPVTLSTRTCGGDSRDHLFSTTFSCAGDSRNPFFHALVGPRTVLRCSYSSHFCWLLDWEVPFRGRQCHGRPCGSRPHSLKARENKIPVTFRKICFITNIFEIYFSSKKYFLLFIFFCAIWK